MFVRACVRAWEEGGGDREAIGQEGMWNGGTGAIERIDIVCGVRLRWRDHRAHKEVG
jgi:hypothetical protein